MSLLVRQLWMRMESHVIGAPSRAMTSVLTKTKPKSLSNTEHLAATATKDFLIQVIQPVLLQPLEATSLPVRQPWMRMASLVIGAPSRGMNFALTTTKLNSLSNMVHLVATAQ